MAANLEMENAPGALAGARRHVVANAVLVLGQPSGYAGILRQAGKTGRVNGEA